MKLTILVLAVFVCYVSACLPPGITFYVYNNLTLFKEAMRAQDSGVATGWAHSVGSPEAPFKPWPVSNDGLVTIPYCFASEDTKHFEYTGIKYETADLINKAWHEWGSRLNSGHIKHSKLSWIKEVTKDGKSLLCRKGSGSLNWNPDVLEDAVEVKFGGDFGDAYATEGYLPKGSPPPFHMAGRHSFTVGTEGDKVPAVRATRTMNFIMAHELGHVFGLHHEHQRSDRDKYVFFNCKALWRYDEVKAAAEADGHKMEDVCKSNLLGHYYKFAATEFSTDEKTGTYSGPPAEFGQQWTQGITMSKDYDAKSIMHYNSYTGIRIPDKQTLELSSLVKWKTPYEKEEDVPKTATSETAEIMYINFVPSPLDIQALVELYPV